MQPGPYIFVPLGGFVGATIPYQGAALVDLRVDADLPMLVRASWQAVFVGASARLNLQL